MRLAQALLANYNHCTWIQWMKSDASEAGDYRLVVFTSWRPSKGWSFISSDHKFTMHRIHCSSHIRRMKKGECPPLSAQSIHILLDKGSRAVRNMFSDFSSAFKTIHPLPSPQPLEMSSWQMTDMRVRWITDCLTRLKTCTSDTVTSSTGAPRGAVPSPVLFALSTADF